MKHSPINIPESANKMASCSMCHKPSLGARLSTTDYYISLHYLALVCIAFVAGFTPFRFYLGEIIALTIFAAKPLRKLLAAYSSCGSFVATANIHKIDDHDGLILPQADPTTQHGKYGHACLRAWHIDFPSLCKNTLCPNPSCRWIVGLLSD
jgi:hypothetical protein